MTLKNPNPECTVIIPFSAEAADCAALLAANARSDHLARHTVLVAPQRLSGKLYRWVERRSYAVSMLILPDAAYKRSVAINLAAAQSSTPIIAIIDGNIHLERRTLTELCRHAGRETFATLRYIKRAGANAGTLPELALSGFSRLLRLKRRDGSQISVETGRYHLKQRARSGIGTLVVMRDQFVGINGMNALLDNSGLEDIDVLVRLQLAAGLKRVEYGTGHEIAATAPAAGALKAYSSGYALAISHYWQGNLSGTLQHDCERWCASTRILSGPSRAE